MEERDAPQLGSLDTPVGEGQEGEKGKEGVWAAASTPASPNC